MTGSSVRFRLVALAKGRNELPNLTTRAGLGPFRRNYIGTDRGSRKSTLPLGVIGNTPDSGSGESWFEPRRGNLEGWPSGLRRRPAKALGYGPRGFESHPLRLPSIEDSFQLPWTGGRVA